GVRRLVQEGRQVYFLCPLVEESEKMQARAATVMAEHLQNEVFPDLRVGLLHGQMPSYQKDETMERFREREIDILVATVVIEVGEEDLRLRGPGEFYGTKQSGILKLRIANIIGDTQILERAREKAFALVAADPGLERPEHAPLRRYMEARFASLMLAAAG